MSLQQWRRSMRSSKVVQALTSMRILLVCLALLFIQTFWGTWHQSEHGLFAAQQQFFNSWYFLGWGFLPFPGAKAVLWVMFISLTAVVSFRLVYSWPRLGIVLIHFGLLLFFATAFSTYYYAEEAFLSLAEGEGNNQAASYREWELSLWTGNASLRQVTAVDVARAANQGGIALTALGTTVEIKNYAPNCTPLGPMQVAKGNYLNKSGIAGFAEAPLSNEPAENIPCIVITLSGPLQTEKPILLYGNEPDAFLLGDGEKATSIVLRRKRLELPFMVQLFDFKKDIHPGTDTARSFESRVKVLQHGIDREVLISMNNPLREREYTLYQSSYAQDQSGREISTFAVVKNSGMILPYVASAFTFGGLLLHFLLMFFKSMRRSPKAARVASLAVLALLTISTVLPARAEEGDNKAAPVASSQERSAPLISDKQLDFTHFERIAVQDQGRVKPLDTFARSLLLQFSGKSSYKGTSASAWLAALLFAPQTTFDLPIFLINDPQVVQSVGLTSDPSRRYSFAQLQPALQKFHTLSLKIRQVEEKERNTAEQEILRVNRNMQVFAATSAAFLFAVPRKEFAVAQSDVRTYLEFPADKVDFTFMDVFSKVSLISEKLQGLNPGAAFPPFEAELFRLSAALYEWFHQAPDVSALPIIPLPEHSGEAGQWYSPWDVIRSQGALKPLREEIGLLEDLSSAYLSGNQVGFDLAAKNFNARVSKLGHIDEFRLALERFYNAADPFYRAELLYGFAFLLILASLLIWTRWLYRCGAVLVGLGAILHVAGLVSRIVIMQRPPVTSLFETFIFVGFIIVILGIVLDLLGKKPIGLFSASLSGLVLLLIAGKYAADGDTMQMLVAVLNSNFWLSTHVICITIGYAGCCIAGVVGHLYILQALLHPERKDALLATYKATYGLIAFGLLFSFIGTVLGGIWADQSWGRFWGWDPKENGALLIVLWCTIILHGKIGNIVGHFGVAVLAVLGIINVMLAWFGINLLGVGLHSYGFTSGIANNLFLYIALQLLFVAVFAPFAHKRLRASLTA